MSTFSTDDNVEPLVPKDKKEAIEKALRDTKDAVNPTDEEKNRILGKIRKKQ